MSSANASPISQSVFADMLSDKSEQFVPESADTNSAIYQLYDAFLTTNVQYIKPYQCVLKNNAKDKFGKQRSRDRKSYAGSVMNGIRLSISQEIDRYVKSYPNNTDQSNTVNLLETLSREKGDKNNTEAQEYSQDNPSNENNPSHNENHDALVNAIHTTIDENGKELLLNRNRIIFQIEKAVFSCFLRKIESEIQPFHDFIEILIQSNTESVVSQIFDNYSQLQRLKDSVSNVVVTYLNTHEPSQSRETKSDKISVESTYPLDEKFKTLLIINGIEDLTIDSKVMKEFIQNNLLPYVQKILIPESHPDYRSERKWKFYNQRIVNCMAAVVTLHKFTCQKENSDLIEKVLDFDFPLVFPYEWWVVYEFHRQFFLQGCRPTKEQKNSMQNEEDSLQTDLSSDSQDAESKKHISTGSKKTPKKEIKVIPPSHVPQSDQQKYIDLQKEINTFYITLNKCILIETKRLFFDVQIDFETQHPNFDNKSNQLRPIQCIVEKESSRPPMFNDIRESIYTFRKALKIKDESTMDTKEFSPFFHPVEEALIKVVLKFDIKSEPPQDANKKKRKR